MRKALRLSCLSAMGLVMLTAGCNSSHILQPAADLTGNWSFTVPASQNQPALTMNAGISTQADGVVTAVAHLKGASCISSETAIQLTGSIDEMRKLTLKSTPFNGTVLSLKTQVGTDNKSLSDTSLSFSGGSCTSLGVVAAATTQYQQINGTYSGTFIDQDGDSISVTSTLTQTTQPDVNGQFHVAGSATFPSDPCFSQPLITDSLVTGQNWSTTYTENGQTIQAIGTLNSDATQLTVSNWTVTGGMCGGLSGTGLLTKQ